MAEFANNQEKIVNVGDTIIFESKTGSCCEVDMGIIFRKSGRYDISVNANRVIVSRVSEQKTGKWIKVHGKTAINCSACYHCSWSLSFEDMVKRFNFCPNCGAKMEVEDDNDVH